MKTKTQKSLKTKVFIDNTLVWKIITDGHFGTISNLNQSSSKVPLQGRAHLTFVREMVTTLASKMGVPVTDDNSILKLGANSELWIYPELTHSSSGSNNQISTGNSSSSKINHNINGMDERPAIWFEYKGDGYAVYYEPKNTHTYNGLKSAFEQVFSRQHLRIQQVLSLVEMKVGEDYMFSLPDESEFSRIMVRRIERTEYYKNKIEGITDDLTNPNLSSDNGEEIKRKKQFLEIATHVEQEDPYISEEEKIHRIQLLEYMCDKFHLTPREVITLGETASEGNAQSNDVKSALDKRVYELLKQGLVKVPQGFDQKTLIALYEKKFRNEISEEDFDRAICDMNSNKIK